MQTYQERYEGEGGDYGGSYILGLRYRKVENHLVIVS